MKYRCKNYHDIPYYGAKCPTCAKNDRKNQAIEGENQKCHYDSCPKPITVHAPYCDYHGKKKNDNQMMRANAHGKALIDQFVIDNPAYEESTYPEKSIAYISTMLPELATLLRNRVEQSND